LWLLREVLQSEEMPLPQVRLLRKGLRLLREALWLL
jgi:hypothetical protein